MEEAPPPAVAKAAPIRNLTLYAAGLPAFCLVAGLFLGGRLRPDDVDRSVKRVIIPLPPDVRFALANHDIKISPDGTRLVFFWVDQGASEHHLFLRRMDERDARPVPGTDGAFQPFFLPDGEWLCFHSDKKLMKVPVGGGPAIHLCPQSEPLGASWSDDGFIYFAETDSGERNGIYRIPEAGGTPERVTVPDQASGEVAHWRPEILPGGRAILFHTQSVDTSGISAVSLTDGERRDLIAPNYS